MNTNDTHDAIDRIVSEWRVALPDLDPSPLEVVGRVLVVAQRLEERVSSILSEHKLTLGQFDILATLRRNGPRGELSPSELLKNVALSSGGMTARLDKLEEAGLIRRKPDPIDRRMLVIELTEQGEQLIDAAAASRFTEARDSLPPFSSFELKTLEDLLRRWLFTLEATQRHQTVPLGLSHQQRPQVKK
jgi:DNA-binding MarR family transcriptional regulator